MKTHTSFIKKEGVHIMKLKNIIVIVTFLLASLWLVACTSEPPEEPTVFIVTIDEMEEQTVIAGEKAAIPVEDPIREGYDFLGWYLGDEAYDFNQAVTSDLTIVSKWEKIDYQVTGKVIDRVSLYALTHVEITYLDQTVITDDDGLFTLAFQHPLTNISLKFNINGYHEKEIDLLATQIQSGDHFLNVELESNQNEVDEHRIYGVVYQGDYYPLENVAVTLNGNIVLTTNANGYFEHSFDAELEDIVISFAKAGFESKTITLTAEQHQNNYFKSVELIPIIEEEQLSSYTISGQVLGLNGAIEGATVKIEGTDHEVLTDVHGYYELTAVTPDSYQILVEKTGYDNRAFTISQATFKLIEIISIDFELYLESVDLGAVGGTNSVLWNGYATRGLTDLVFTFRTNEIANHNQAIGLFLSVGNNDSATRTNRNVLIQYMIGGAIRIYNYPNNSKTTLAIGTTPLPNGIRTNWSFDEGTSEIVIHIPYTFFNGLFGDTIDYHDVIGISMTTDDVAQNKWDVWYRPDLLGVSGTPVVNRENPRDYLRLSAHNDLFNATNNFDTIIQGLVPAGAKVIYNGLSVAVNAQGLFSIERWRTGDETEASIVISQEGYVTQNITFALTEQTYYDLGSIELIQELITVLGNVKDQHTSQSLAGVTIAYLDQTATTDSQGHFELVDVTAVNDIVIQLSKDGYVTVTRTITVAELSNPEFVLSVLLAPEDFTVDLTGLVVDIFDNLADATVRIIELNIQTTSDVSGNYTFIDLPVANYTFEFSKMGYETKTWELSAETIGSAAVSSVLLEIERVNLGDIGGSNNTVLWQGYAGRNDVGFIFAYETTQTPNENEGIGIFLNIGDNDFSTRNAKIYIFQALSNGTINVGNYPLNIRQALPNDGVILEVTIENGMTKLHVLIPYTYFLATQPNEPQNDHSVIGISMTSDNTQTSTWAAWNRSDLLGNNGLEEVNRHNPRDYLRLSALNQLFEEVNNFNTVINGSVNQVNAAVSYGDYHTTTDANGDFTIKFNRDLTQSQFELIVSKQGYETEPFTIELNKNDIMATYPIEVELAVKYVDINGIVIDSNTGAELENVTISYNGNDVVSNETGLFSLTDIPTNMPLNISAALSGYATYEYTISIAELNNEAFTLSIQMVSSETEFKISGVVDNVNGTVEAVSVKINGYPEFDTATDASGYYEIDGVLLGNYVLIFEKTGYEPFETTITSAELIDASNQWFERDVEILLERNALGPVGGTNTSIVWEMYATRTKDYLIFDFETTSTVTSIHRPGVYLQLGNRSHARSFDTILIAYTIENKISVRHYGASPTSILDNVDGSGELGINSVWTIENGMTKGRLYISHDYLSALRPIHNHQALTDISFSVTVDEGSVWDVWYREDLIGLSGHYEVWREYPWDMLLLDSYNVLSVLNYNLDQFAAFVNASSAYQEGYAFDANRATMQANDAIKTLSIGERIFNNRLDVFGPAILDAIWGWNYALRPIGGGASVTTATAGYVVMIAQGTGNATLNTNITNAGWTLVLERYGYVGHNYQTYTGPDASGNGGNRRLEQANYYVKWVDAGTTINFTQWHIVVW